MFLLNSLKVRCYFVESRMDFFFFGDFFATVSNKLVADTLAGSP